MPNYRIKRVVQAYEVPNWERRPPKWADLVEQVIALEPGQSLEVFFDDASEAERARNAVRDGVSLRTKKNIVRTRLVKDDEEDGGATIFLIRVHDGSHSV